MFRQHFHGWKLVWRYFMEGGISTFDLHEPQMGGNEIRFILSKGHGCLTLYAILADLGIFLKVGSWTIFVNHGSLLAGHPDTNIPGVEGDIRFPWAWVRSQCGLGVGRQNVIPWTMECGYGAWRWRMSGGIGLGGSNVCQSPSV